MHLSYSICHIRGYSMQKKGWKRPRLETLEAIRPNSPLKTSLPFVFIISNMSYVPPQVTLLGIIPSFFLMGPFMRADRLAWCSLDRMRWRALSQPLSLEREASSGILCWRTL